MRKNFSIPSGDEKIVPFEKAKKYYGKLIDERADKGDLVGAISVAFSSLKNDYSADTLGDIADIYADMGEYELSDEFWYKYLSVSADDKKSVAYEELAINAFECKNYALAAYYLDKKIALDGALDRKELGREMLEFLSEGLNKKDLYKIVYPENKSDYSTDITVAKNAAASGNFEGAAKILEGVPNASPSYKEAAEELSLCYFALGKIKEAIDINRELAKDSGSVSVYSNLSSMYRAEKDYDKSAYYYSLAKSMPIDENDEFKFALCAVEQNDHETAAKMLKRVITDDFYDPKIICFYGIALFNTGNPEKAESEIKKAYMINPRDPYLKYLVRLVSAANESGNTDGLYPLSYEPELPKKEIAKRLKTLNIAAATPLKLKAEEKKNLNDYIAWGLRSGDSEFKASVTAIFSDFNKEKEEIVCDALLSCDVSPHLKQTLIFMLLLNGYKKRVYVSSGGVFFTFKPRKLPCEEIGDPFFLAYCTAISKMAFSGENMDKIAFSVNELYKKFKDAEVIKLLSKDELAAAAVVGAGYETFSKPEFIYGIFGVKKEKMDTVIKTLGVDGNGKNN